VARPLKFSIVIPYKDRLDTAKLVLASLIDQTMDPAEFEVIVGVLEYSPAYVEMCRNLTGKLKIVSVLSAVDWNVGHARNLAMRHASGEVLLLLDADMMIPPNLLQSLYERYFAGGRNVCVLGQAVDYRSATDVHHTEALDYEDYRPRLAELAVTHGLRDDRRWMPAELPLPWAVVWTCVVALPTTTVRHHDLTFDEVFRGWGSEDQEWGLRLGRTGTPIVRGEDIYAIHLPHKRDAGANAESLRVNQRYFLTKWPLLEVELVYALEWKDANRVYADICRDIASVTGDPGRSLGIARGAVDGRDVLLVGGVMAGGDWTGDLSPADLFDDGEPIDMLPLTGIGLPYPDRSVGEIRILPPILALRKANRELVLREAHRVCDRVVYPVVR